jgi:hypothetical protein
VCSVASAVTRVGGAIHLTLMGFHGPIAGCFRAIHLAFAGCLLALEITLPQLPLALLLLQLALNRAHRGFPLAAFQIQLPALIPEFHILLAIPVGLGALTGPFSRGDRALLRTLRIVEGSLARPFLGSLRSFPGALIPIGSQQACTRDCRACIPDDDLAAGRIRRDKGSSCEQSDAGDPGHGQSPGGWS